MNIFYVGQLSWGGTCLDRLRALQRLGHDVVGFDVCRYESRFRIVRSAQWRWSPTLLLRELNRGVISAAAALRPDCVWVDKGVWIFPDTLSTLKLSIGCRLVHYTPDSQILINKSSHFLASIPTFDCLFTTKTFEAERYRALGAQRLVLLPQSYCPVRFSNPEHKTIFAYDVGFVSDFKPSYGEIIGKLNGSIADIGVWGPRWGWAAERGYVPPGIVKGDAIWGENYVNALASFKIGLGLLSKAIPERHTTRSFEIPASGSFLLAERTAEHQAFFEEGKEAEFFADAEELASKAQFYLANDAARKRIAARGRSRCHRSGYDNDSVLSRAMSEIK